MIGHKVRQVKAIGRDQSRADLERFCMDQSERFERVLRRRYQTITMARQAAVSADDMTYRDVHEDTTIERRGITCDNQLSPVQ